MNVKKVTEEMIIQHSYISNILAYSSSSTSLSWIINKQLALDLARTMFNQKPIGFDEENRIIFEDQLGDVSKSDYKSTFLGESIEFSDDIEGWRIVVAGAAELEEVKPSTRLAHAFDIPVHLLEQEQKK